MTIFNNSPKTNRIHYKVDGKTFFFILKGYETADIPFLTSYSQIVGKYDRKTLEIGSVISDSTINGYLRKNRLGIKQPAVQEAGLPTTFDMRSVLSVAGQARYDAVSDNQWFLVDRTDYEAVRAEALASQYIMDDDSLYVEENLNTFAANLWLSYNDNTRPEGAIPEGKRIIGYTYRTTSVGGSFVTRLDITPTFKANILGTGTQIGNTFSGTYFPASTQTYLLLKNATTVTESKSYINQLNNLGTRQTVTGLNYPMAWSNNNGSSWSDWTTTSILMQVIATELTPA